MRKKKINTTSLAAKEYVYLARRFNNRASSLARGTRYKFYDGTLFKTTASAKEIATTVLVLPVYALALNITSQIGPDFANGRGAFLRDVDITQFSRDAFYAKDGGVDIAAEAKTRPANIPDPIAYGDPMPEGTMSFIYTGFTGKKAEGYTTTRANRPFHFLNTVRPTTITDTPFVLPADKFWVEAVLCRGGDRFTRLTFSEDWFSQYAPGHKLASRAHRYRVTAGYVAACSNGTRLAISVPLCKAQPFNEVTNNYDTGVCNALTLCFDLSVLDEDGRPEVLWTSFWDREADNDPRTAPYPMYAESPYDSADYNGAPPTGTARNTVEDILEMDAEGEVFGIRAITTSIKLPERRSIQAPDEPYDVATLALFPVGGQVVQYIEWSATGARTSRLLAAGASTGPYYYNQVDAEPRLALPIKNDMKALLEAYGVPGVPANASGTTATTLYELGESGVGYDANGRYVFLIGIRIFTGAIVDGEERDISPNRQVSFLDSTQYSVVQDQGGQLTAYSYQASILTYESVYSRGTGVLTAPGLDGDGFFRQLANANIRVPAAAFIGSGAFAVVATTKASDPGLDLLLGFVGVAGAYSRAIPQGQTAATGTINDTGVRTIQEELPNSDPNEPPSPSVLAVTDDSGAYISNDGGATWTRAISGVRYRDLVYISNNLVVRPFSKGEPVT
jgi:hypothetical protein